MLPPYELADWMMPHFNMMPAGSRAQAESVKAAPQVPKSTASYLLRVFHDLDERPLRAQSRSIRAQALLSANSREDLRSTSNPSVRPAAAPHVIFDGTVGRVRSLFHTTLLGPETTQSNRQASTNNTPTNGANIIIPQLRRFSVPAWVTVRI